MQILNLNMNFTFVVWLLIKTQFVAPWPEGVLLKLSQKMLNTMKILLLSNK